MCNSVFVAHARLAARAIDATKKSKEIVSRASNTSSSFNVTFAIAHAHSKTNIVSIHILQAIAGNACAYCASKPSTHDLETGTRASM